MSYNLKENVMKEDRLSGGHRMCAGCGSPIAVRTVLRALNPEDHGGCVLRHQLPGGVHLHVPLHGVEGQLHPQRLRKRRRPPFPAWRRPTAP